MRPEPEVMPLGREVPDESRRDLRAYLALAYGLSWLWLVPLAASGAVVIAGRGWPTHFPALLGPTFAALIVTGRRSGWKGVGELGRRMTRVRVPLRWWVMSLSPLLLLGVVVAVDLTFGLDAPRARDFASFNGLPATIGPLGVTAALLLVNGLGEETGWRGFALPRLQRRFRPLAASLILAAFWAGWHTPMFLTVETFRAFSLPGALGWTFGLFCGAVVLGWLYNRTGSILLAAIWHATFNVVSGTRGATGLPAAVSTTAVVGLALVLVCLEARASHRGLPTVIGPKPTPVRWARTTRTAGPTDGRS